VQRNVATSGESFQACLLGLFSVKRFERNPARVGAQCTYKHLGDPMSSLSSVMKEPYVAHHFVGESDLPSLSARPDHRPRSKTYMVIEPCVWLLICMLAATHKSRPVVDTAGQAVALAPSSSAWHALRDQCQRSYQCYHSAASDCVGYASLIRGLRRQAGVCLLYCRSGTFLTMVTTVSNMLCMPCTCKMLHNTTTLCIPYFQTTTTLRCEEAVNRRLQCLG
jgi:hypothetical protein